MAEKAPKPMNEAEERLASFDANKEAHATQQYWEELLTVNNFDSISTERKFAVASDGTAEENVIIHGGDRIDAAGIAGKDVFTDEARQQLEEAVAYDKHLEGLASRGEESEEDYYNRQAEEGAENSFDRALLGSAVLRRADMMAKEIARRRAEGGDEEYIRAQEGELERILNEYADSPDADQDVAMRIMDATVVSVPGEAPAPRSTEGKTKVSVEDITNLQTRTKENWAKTPNAPAATPESPVRQAYPSTEDIDAARQAAGEKGTPENSEIPATGSETEPVVDDKEKSKEKRMSKIRRGFNRALGWLMAEKKDNGSSEDETKTDEEAATQPTTPKATSMFAGVRKPFADMSAERRAKRAARAEGDAVEGDSAAVEEGEKAPEPTEADKAAAAAAVKADTGPTQKGRLSDKVKGVQNKYREAGYLE